MIHGYPNHSSIFPGDTLTLHVSTDQPQFRVEFYRQGKTLEFKDHPESKLWKAGQFVPKRAANRDWDWPGYEFAIPNNWSSGVYIVMFFEGDKDGKQVSSPQDLNSADGRDAKTLFTLKSATPGRTARILYKLSLFTYHAYNAEGDPWGSLYQPKIYKAVTLQRPGGGTGGSPYDTFAPDFYDPASPRQTFTHWDTPFIRWLELHGYQVEYCTDLDIHRNLNGFLDNYPLLLSVGHDEYWSEDMRTNVETAIQNGLNVAFFSGNTCFRRVTFDTETIFGHRIEWTKVKSQKLGHSWPENSLTGVSYRNGGGRWAGPREPVGYTVQYDSHWIYEGTGLHNGDIFGKEQHLTSPDPLAKLVVSPSAEPLSTPIHSGVAGCLVGYEFDGAKLRDNRGILVPTGKDGTPLTFIALGIGRITPGGSASFPRWRNNWDEAEIYGKHTATMGLYTNTGIVFTAATTDWARVLEAGDASVGRITQNVLNRLKVRGLRISIEGPSPSMTTVPSAVEGQLLTLHVHADGLLNQQNLHYEWAISGGEAAALDQPTLQTKMPSGPMTITVTVMNGAAPCGFGTITLTPQGSSQASLPTSGIGGLLAKVKNIFGKG